MHYRNAAHAFVSELRHLSTSGSRIEVRGSETREVTSRVVTLRIPTERCITLAGRRNSIFAAIAETMWVLAGRNDLEFLNFYLERAPFYSDDSRTWRAGYGPRLRDWNGVDQVAEVLRILTNDLESRRAVIVLFDPDRDFVDSKDIPCNNWLHFTVRNGRLNMNIAVRSNDIVWGFSGINTFEWSVLQEMIAHWLGVAVGETTFFITSLHLYDRQSTQARRVLESFTGETGYEKGWRPVEFATDWDQFQETILDWFDIESQIRLGHDVGNRIVEFSDPLLRQFLQVLQILAMKIFGSSDDEIQNAISELGRTDLAYAVQEHFFRNSAKLDAIEMSQSDEGKIGGGGALREAIVELHRQKSSAYGASWKKRGEQLGVVANIDRKIDRIEMATAGASLGDESLFDTVTDLFVYCIKYQTYLADRDAHLAQQIFGHDQAGPFSDDNAGFELLVSRIDFDATRQSLDIRSLVNAVLATSVELDASFESFSSEETRKRQEIVLRLSDEVLSLLIGLGRSDPASAIKYVDNIFLEDESR